jgi:hypothetical protein
LINKNFLLYNTIWERTFLIYLVEFESLGCDKASKSHNGLKTCHRSKCFPKVLIFYLAISLCYKVSLVSHNLTVLPLFVLKHPFGVNHIDSMKRMNQSSDLVSLKVL